MSSWVRRVGELTTAHREGRAQGFAKMARRRLWQRRAEGFSDLYAKTDGAWYTARERGQRERPARVEACGSETLYLTCAGCGVVHEHRSGCRIGLLCVPCRKASATSKRGVFRRARAVCIDEAVRRGLFNPSRRGGRWSEKFMTLTAPHFPRHSISERIWIVLRAWSRFLRFMNSYWKARGIRSAEWFRVFEWTPGDDEQGHPHLHLWILSPYLPHDEIESWWRQALAEETGASIQRVVVKISEVYGDSAEHELIKYLTKDITATGEKLAPELYAEVYKALDGHRTTQASRGFIAKAKAEQRTCECGCTFPPRVRKGVKAPGKAKP